MLAFYLSLLSTQEEQDKFEYLYRKYRPLLHHVAYRILHDPHLAEDAVQNTFLKIISNFHEVDDTDSNRTKRFLVVVTENAAKDILRKNKRLKQVDFEQAAPFLASTPDMLGNISAEELADHIAALPEIYRIPLELRVHHGLSEKRIANILEISYEAVRKRLERARKLLAIAITQEQTADSL